jgi:hypothetical protein
VLLLTSRANLCVRAPACPSFLPAKFAQTTSYPATSPHAGSSPAGLLMHRLLSWVIRDLDILRPPEDNRIQSPLVCCGASHGKSEDFLGPPLVFHRFGFGGPIDSFSSSQLRRNRFLCLQAWLVCARLMARIVCCFSHGPYSAQHEKPSVGPHRIHSETALGIFHRTLAAEDPRVVFHMRAISECMCHCRCVVAHICNFLSARSTLESNESGFLAKTARLCVLNDKRCAVGPEKNAISPSGQLGHHGEGEYQRFSLRSRGIANGTSLEMLMKPREFLLGPMLILRG